MGKNVETSVIKVRLGEIQPDPEQPRKDFNQAALEQLAESLKSNGLLQPIIVRRNPNCDPSKPRYLLIAGERRWRAAGILGWETIPAIVRKDISEAEACKLQLLENIVRQDLNPVEEARAYRKMLDEGYTIQELSEAIGLAPSAITRWLDMLGAREDVLGLVARGHLAPTAAVAMAKLTPDGQGRVLRALGSQRLTGREIIAVSERVLADENQVEMFPETKLSDEQRQVVSTFGEAFRRMGAVLCQLQALEDKKPGAIAQALAAESGRIEVEVDEAVKALYRVKKALQVDRVSRLVEVV